MRASCARPYLRLHDASPTHLHSPALPYIQAVHEGCSDEGLFTLDVMLHCGYGAPMRLRCLLKAHRIAAACTVLTLALACGRTAYAQGICTSDGRSVEGLRALRALSLDLRGTIPKSAEYATMLDQIRGAAANDREVVEQTVLEGFTDTWLASEDFVEQALERHRALLLNNIKATALVSPSVSLAITRDAQNAPVYWRTRAAIPSRGAGNGDTGVAVPCDANTPATFDDDGRIETVLNATGHRIEGFVEVTPYWYEGDTERSGQTVKVCAFDAQEVSVSRDGTDCSLPVAISDGGCGCGPSLRHCKPPSLGTLFATQLTAELDERLRNAMRNDAPYLTLFTSRNGYINGPLLHYFRYLRDATNTASVLPLPFDASNLDADNIDIPFNDLTMRPFDYGPQHAGVLTSPAFLIRFQTNRARANRFYEAFLCQPFQAPPGGLPSPADACSQEPDLQQRCGCKFCHSLLEPSAAYWGRWRQKSAGYLYPALYPREREDCSACARNGGCSRECKTEYVVTAQYKTEEPYLGQLQAYLFRRSEHEANIDEGPALLARRAFADNRMPTCIARHTANWLLGRPPNTSEQAWFDKVATDFGRDKSYRQLVRAIVTSAVYRRAR